MASTVAQLQYLKEKLTPRDEQILFELDKCQVMLTHQVQRLLFTDSANGEASNKACRRNLNKLSGYGLVGKLDRRIGGFKAGSSAHIWYLTEAGYRMLGLYYPDRVYKRKRFVEPSSLTLKHRATAVECYVQLMIMEQEGKLFAKNIELETASWRTYIHNGKKTNLKPDLFADIIRDGYEYLYFIEIDLATETMTDIIRQCERYHDYYEAQVAKAELFPAVLWIVPNKKRKDLFIKVLKKQYEKAEHLFSVIAADELEDYMMAEIDKLEFI